MKLKVKTTFEVTLLDFNWPTENFRIRKTWDNNKVLRYSTANYIQYSVINHNGKEYEKEKIYIYIIESLCCTPETNTTL